MLFVAVTEAGFVFKINLGAGKVVVGFMITLWMGKIFFGLPTFFSPDLVVLDLIAVDLGAVMADVDATATAVGVEDMVATTTSPTPFGNSFPRLGAESRILADDFFSLLVADLGVMDLGVVVDPIDVVVFLVWLALGVLIRLILGAVGEVELGMGVVLVIWIALAGFLPKDKVNFNLGFEGAAATAVAIAVAVGVSVPEGIFIFNDILGLGEGTMGSVVVASPTG